MKTANLETNNPSITLVEPDLERDPELGVSWLEGDVGRSTLALMGVAEKNIKSTTLEQEQGRVKGFIENKNQLNWMIKVDDMVVGSIWVDLEPLPYSKLLWS